MDTTTTTTRSNNHTVTTRLPLISGSAITYVSPNNDHISPDAATIDAPANDERPWWRFLHEEYRQLVDFYVEDTVSFVFICAIVVTGLVCGVIMMPAFLSAATNDVYPDVCDVKACVNGNQAMIYARGFRYSGRLWRSSSCRDMVGWTGVDCFLRPSRRNATYEVFLSRPGFVIGVYVGAIGWSALIAVVAWFLMCMCRKARRDDLAYIKPKIYCALVIMFLYALCAAASAVLLLVWGRVGLATSDCVIKACNQSHYATIYAPVYNATTVTYTSHNCSMRIGESYSSCYYNANHGYLLGHVPALNSVVGLTSSSCAALVACLVIYFSFHVAHKCRGNVGKSTSSAQEMAQP